MRLRGVLLVMMMLTTAETAQAETNQAEREAALKKLLDGHKQPYDPWVDAAVKLSKKDARIAAWSSFQCRQAQHKLDHEPPTSEAMDRVYEHCWIKQ